VKGGSGVRMREGVFVIAAGLTVPVCAVSCVPSYLQPVQWRIWGARVKGQGEKKEEER
jgi:hypothetical protein